MNAQAALYRVDPVDLVDLVEHVDPVFVVFSSLLFFRGVATTGFCCRCLDHACEGWRPSEDILNRNGTSRQQQQQQHRRHERGWWLNQLGRRRRGDRRVR